MAIVGFMTYEDFRNEVHDAGVKMVRMQDFIRRTCNNAGITELHFLVELAAASGEDIYVARFRLGNAWDVEIDAERAKADRAQENAERAKEFLRQDLERLGVQVRPGVVAGADAAKVETLGPWRWEKDEVGPVLVSE